MSCSLYFTDKRCYLSRGAHYLCFHPKGQTKVLTIARSALEIADYSTGQVHKPIHLASSLIEDIKVTLNFVYVPCEISSWRQKVVKTHAAFQTLYNAGWGADYQVWLTAGVSSAGLIKKSFSILGDGLFKPLLVIGKFTDLGPASDPLCKTWQVCSLIKSTSKICNCVGKLWLGRRKPAKKVVQITLETWEIVHVALRLGGVRVHPISNIVLALLKSIFGFVEIWMKTA